MSDEKTDFQKGWEAGQEGRPPPDSSSQEYSLGYRRGREEKEELDKLSAPADLKADPNFRRGFRNGKDGRPPSDLSSTYIKGYELGRQKYLDERDEVRRNRLADDDPDSW